jgi:cellulose synthase/poly-beta-1,6-N-acetylglucosamine synthase-like glycosyltransferase
MLATIPFVIYCAILSLLGFGYGLGYVFVYTKSSSSRNPCTSASIRKKVDVVIPVKNEKDLLLKKLQNIASQSYPYRLLKTIVVDSSCDGACEEVVRRFSLTNPTLNVIFVGDTDRLGKAHALNQAFTYCTGEICVLTDVDVTFDECAISSLVSNFEDPKIGAVSGMEVLVGERKLTDAHLYRNFYNALRIAESNLDSVLMCESELSAYRSDLLHKLPENTQCDDMRLTLSIRALGYRAIYDSRVLFYESEGKNRTSMLLQKTRRARANAHELLRSSTFVLSGRLGDFSRIILPFELFLNIVAPVLLLATIILYFVLLVDPSTALVSSVLFWLSISVLLVSVLLFESETRSVKDRVKRVGLFIASFLEFNLILFAGLALLIARGPQANWNPIERDT